VSQKLARVVLCGIAIESVPREPIFEKCSHLRDKGGVLTLRTPVEFCADPYSSRVCVTQSQMHSRGGLTVPSSIKPEQRFRILRQIAPCSRIARPRPQHSQSSATATDTDTRTATDQQSDWPCVHTKFSNPDCIRADIQRRHVNTDQGGCYRLQ
jgi:hypothetical protein